MKMAGECPAILIEDEDVVTGISPRLMMGEVATRPFLLLQKRRGDDFGGEGVAA